MTTNPNIDPALRLRSTHGPTGHTLDFGRKLRLVLGLPFDVTDLPAVLARIRSAVRSGTRLFISTPNTNFVVAAAQDTAFRDSVFHSDLSLMDSMPLVFFARLIGIPVPHRVSGSDLFEALRLSGSEQISVYFFGGQPGAAATAAANINSAKGPMRCVGYAEPGFGDIESMSNQTTIDHINASGADFLVVSLGAVKGQAWIERNLSKIEVPVVSHLGAVINFVAGTVVRAPPWMRTSGLEWLWRIKEEPHLFRRYTSDALGIIKLIAKWVLRNAWRTYRPQKNGTNVEIETIESSREVLIRFSGSLGAEFRSSLIKCILPRASFDGQLVVDLNLLTALSQEAFEILYYTGMHRRRCGIPYHVIANEASIVRLNQNLRTGGFDLFKYYGFFDMSEINIKDEK